MTTALYQDDESRWQAVRTRNVHADGIFFYGVRSTRIYCRPACKARLARRANVSFYADAAAAQAAGFRACKRCKPEVVGFMPEERAVRMIREFVIAASAASTTTGGDGTAQGMSLARMAKEVGLSKWHFHRVFKKCVGVTPVEYVRMMRQNKPVDFLNPEQENMATLDVDGQGSLGWMMEYSRLDTDTLPEGREQELLTSDSGGGALVASDPLDDILHWSDDWWNTPIG